MRKPAAAIATAAFFVAAPGTVAGLVPWWITGWQTSASGVPKAIGVALIVLGAIPPIHAFIQFAKAGGTPMPVAPTPTLVVNGFNRYIRNPMYFGLLVVILGQALLFGSWALVLYAAIVWATTASFVRWYEEPTLAKTFGAQYEDYRRHVPAWWPRIRPWTPER